MAGIVNGYSLNEGILSRLSVIALMNGAGLLGISAFMNVGASRDIQWAALRAAPTVPAPSG